MPTLIHFLWRQLLYALFGYKLAGHLRRFRDNRGEEVCIDNILSDFVKPIIKSIPRYKVTTYWQRTRNYMPRRVFYIDGQYVFLLSCPDENNIDVDIACLAFDRFGSKSICIKQIQGRPSYGEVNYRDYLKAIKWERFLIKVACQWAKSNNLKVYMVSAKKSPWYNKSRQKEMYMRYDVTARRSGFKFNRLTQYYKLPPSRLKAMAT